MLFSGFYLNHEMYFRKGSHSDHYILLHHLHFYWCILLHIHLVFPYNGCPFICGIIMFHRHIWRPHWCLKYLFLLHLWSFPFFSIFFQEVLCLLFFISLFLGFHLPYLFLSFLGRYACNILAMFWKVSNTLIYET